MTRHVVEATVAGRSLGAVLARAAGMDVSVVDAGVDGEPLAGAEHATTAHARGDLVQGSALHEDDAHRLLAVGHDLGKTAARTYGILALGEVGIGNTTVAAALASLLLGVDAEAVVGLGAGADTAILERKRSVVSRAVARVRAARDATEPVPALREVGGPEFAVLAGVVLGAAAGGSAVVLDGLAVTLAGLVAVRLEPAAQANLIAGQRSREQAHLLVLTELGLEPGLEPVLDVRLRAGEGAGAVLATQMVRTALRARADVARVR